MKFKLIDVERNDGASITTDDVENSSKGVSTLTFVASDVAVAGEFKTVADDARREVSETNAIACPDAVKEVCLQKGSSPGLTMTLNNVSDADVGQYEIGNEYDLS